MGNTENLQENELVCSKCGKTINPGEKILSTSINMGTPNGNNSLAINTSTTINTICFRCASFIFAEAISYDSDLMPWETKPENEGGEDNNDDDDDNSGDDDHLVMEYRPKIVDGEIEPFEDMDDMFGRVRYVHRSKKDDESSEDPDTAKEKLGVQCSDEGFCLTLDCGDGVSKATSRFYNWAQIAQMLIAADPDIFGVLDEPLHAVFPSALTHLGYHVPRWRDSELKQDNNLEENPQMLENRNNEMQDFPEIKPADMYFTLGLHFAKEYDWDHAIKSFTSVIEFEPDNAFAYDRRGIAYGKASHYEESIVDFNTALSIDETFAGAYNNRALCYYKMYDFDKALADYDRAIEIEPDIAVFYANRGLAYRWKEDYVSAIKDFDKAIELDSDLLETHSNRGEVYAILGECEKAIADFDYELEHNPNDMNAYASRATVLDEMNNNTEKSHRKKSK